MSQTTTERTAPGPVPSPPAAPGAGMSHRQLMLVFAGLMLGMLLAALDQTIVATALPTIVGDLNGLDHLSWVVTAYLLTSTAVTPLYGKASDLYGRRPVFQISIVVFLVGSALCGLSQSMTELIGFRAVQGLGGGGLIALAMATIGDVVSPRERGRYQGYFGAVFGLSSVAGPLLGGLFTQTLSWRWIFYINIPLGIAALVVTSLYLHLPRPTGRVQIDYLGSVLMVLGVSSALMVTVWGGTQYAWGSATILGLIVAAVVLLTAFMLHERRHPEPILPPGLFRNRTFALTSGAGFVLGTVMFGAIIYLPLYMQTAHHVGPTVSGLLLLPLMAGVLSASIMSGRAISRIGRYKVFPVVGTVLMVIALAAMTQVGAHTNLVVLAVMMFVLGTGLGLTMQVLVLAVQNAVDIRQMGVATSASTFFRTLGGAFGTALFGAVLTARLSHWLPRLVPGDALAAAGHAFAQGPVAVNHLTGSVRDGVIESFVRSLDTIFVVALPLALVAVVLVVLLPELPLRANSAVRGDDPEGLPAHSGSTVADLGTDVAVGAPAGGLAVQAGGAAGD